jgi:hypothetical protein
VPPLPCFCFRAHYIPSSRNRCERQATVLIALILLTILSMSSIKQSKYSFYRQECVQSASFLLCHGSLTLRLNFCSET